LSWQIGDPIASVSTTYPWQHTRGGVLVLLQYALQAVCDSETVSWSSGNLPVPHAVDDVIVRLPEVSEQSARAPATREKYEVKKSAGSEPGQLLFFIGVTHRLLYAR
jgi:hypothetical protein